MTYEEMRDVAEFLQLAMRPGGTGNLYTAEERRMARALWGRLSGAMESDLNTEAKLLNVTEQIQNYFRKIGYENGVAKIDAVLAKHDKATMVDFSNIRFLLHNFWDDKHELRQELAFDWMENQRHLYQPIYGYEMEYFTKGKYDRARWQTFIDTLDIITNDLIERHVGEMDTLRILDIGSAFGWFPFHFVEDWGMSAVGIDVDVDRFFASRAIKRSLGYELDDYPRFYYGDAPTWVLDDNCRHETMFDYVIMLHTFHHILADDYDFRPDQEERGWKMFNKLINNGTQIYCSMDGHWRDWELKYKRNIPRSVLEQSDATSVKRIGEPIRGRQLYLYS
jgi:hypothetical protein